MAADPLDEGRLRAKYWDWCSARLADRFLSLSADDIYRIARREPSAGRSEGRDTPVGRDAAALKHESGSSFRALVARVTEALAAEMALPTFEEWTAAYRDDPGRFEAELLGMWREAPPAEDAVEG